MPEWSRKAVIIGEGKANTSRSTNGDKKCSTMDQSLYPAWRFLSQNLAYLRLLLKPLFAVSRAGGMPRLAENVHPSRSSANPPNDRLSINWFDRLTPRQQRKIRLTLKWPIHVAMLATPLVFPEVGRTDSLTRFLCCRHSKRAGGKRRGRKRYPTPALHNALLYYLKSTRNRSLQ